MNNMMNKKHEQSFLFFFKIYLHNKSKNRNLRISEENTHITLRFRFYNALNDVALR